MRRGNTHFVLYFRGGAGRWGQLVDDIALYRVYGLDTAATGGYLGGDNTIIYTKMGCCSTLYRSSPTSQIPRQISAGIWKRCCWCGCVVEILICWVGVRVAHFPVGCFGGYNFVHHIPADIDKDRAQAGNEEHNKPRQTRDVYPVIYRPRKNPWKMISPAWYSSRTGTSLRRSSRGSLGVIVVRIHTLQQWDFITKGGFTHVGWGAGLRADFGGGGRGWAFHVRVREVLWDMATNLGSKKAVAEVGGGLALLSGVGRRRSE